MKVSEGSVTCTFVFLVFPLGCVSQIPASNTHVQSSIDTEVKPCYRKAQTIQYMEYLVCWEWELGSSIPFKKRGYCYDKRC